jgi:hypothetical protein
MRPGVAGLLDNLYEEEIPHHAMQPDNQSWDPGRVRDHEERNKLCKINVPDYLYSLMSTMMVSAIDVSEEVNDTEEEESRTELDSHANIPVVGRNAYIISDMGRIADMNSFTPDYASMRISIVDAAVRYDCPYDGKTYIFVLQNALHLPSMKNNLIPPFVMREAGIRDNNDTPKIQTSDPTQEDHSVYFPDNDFRIPLSLWGVFSYFVTSKPSTEQMMNAEDVYLRTPSTMNPHCDAYTMNEENMLDWEGNMVQRRDRVQIHLSDIPEDAAVTASVQVSSAEARTIDTVLEGNVASHDGNVAHPCWQPIPRVADEVSSILASVSPILDNQILYGCLAARADLGKFKASIGSTDISGGEYLIYDDSATETSSDDNMIQSDSDDEDEDQALDELYKRATKGEIDLDTIMVSATHAGKSKGVDPAHLSKIWKIDLKMAERTLDVVPQNNKRTDKPKLSRNYGTNDCMLRYRRIAEYFFMDTFFATKKAGKLSRGYTCCQLFVTDNVPMKSKADVLQAVKQFVKEIGAPDAIICDMAGEQTSHDLKRVFQEIGTTLRVLEEGTPWANKAELYIGLIKEAVRKDMKDSDCPLAFWDYCVEWRARINNLTAKDFFTLHGTKAHTELFGEDGDISNLCQYK